MKPRTKWRIVFLGTIVAALVMELWASFDKDKNTEPLTWFMVKYVPREITIASIGALSLWLYNHFQARYGELLVMEDGRKLTYAMFQKEFFDALESQEVKIIGGKG